MVPGSLPSSVRQGSGLTRRVIAAGIEYSASKQYFYISLTVHLGIILVNNQLDALLSMSLFTSLLYMF